MSDPSDFAEDVIEELLNALRDGKSMREICSDKRMPHRETIMRWAKRDDDLAANIVRAREAGYHARAERAVDEAKSAKDAALGRLAFDAERWHLSKLSRAFADKVVHSGDPDEPMLNVVEWRVVRSGN
jgi:hypothetical protein